MKYLNYYLLVFFLFFISCDGQKQKKPQCNKDQAMKVIGELSESKIQAKYIDSISHHKKGLSFMIDSLKIKNEDFYEIKTGFNSEFHWETYHIFYVSKNNCNKILINEVVSGNTMTIDAWRKSQKQKKMEATNTKFTDLFNESSNIDFTPNDLNLNTEEIKKFKNNLEAYENEHLLLEDFNIKNLEYLINNETFFDSQYFTDSSWLQYFITKYKIDASKLNELMELAIRQEDFNAVKRLVDNKYIVSKKDLIFASEIQKDSNNKIQENKTDGYESYLVSNSRIKLILKLLNDKISINHIQDPDGYTNLRKEKNAQSEILEKIKSGEEIEVLDNTGDWFLVKTKAGKRGYVHRSKIKKANDNSTGSINKPILLYDRPDFTSFSREIIAKDEVEIVHTANGWDYVKVNSTVGYLPTAEQKQELAKTEKRKHSLLADDEPEIEKKKGFWDNLFG